MSFFIPYKTSVVVEYFTSLYNLNLSDLTDYQVLVLTILSNLYFYVFWTIVIYFSLKLFNRIWERMF